MLIMAIEVLMCIRVYAIYNQSKSIIILLVMLMISLVALISVCKLKIYALF